MKNYQALLDEKDDSELNKRVDQKIAPVIEQVKSIEDKLEKAQAQDEAKFQLIIMFYRYQLIGLCRQYLIQGYITVEQYDELSELYRTYSKLGGNGQAKEFYEKAIALPSYREYNNSGFNLDKKQPY